MRQRIVCSLMFIIIVLGSCQFPPESILTLEAYKSIIRLPQDYNSEQNYPLILFLHGRGCGSMDVSDFNSYGMGDYANRTENFPFIIVAPQTYNEWYSSLIDQTLDEIITAYSVDTNRIYVTGFSMGGWGTYLMATEYPTRFAAVAPVAGWWKSEDAYKLKDLPVWIFHDIGDTDVNYSFAQEMYDSLMAHGGDVRLTTYYNYVHNCWNETYANPELYDWFLSNQKQ